MSTYILFGIVFFALYYVFVYPKVKKAKEEAQKKLRDQLLRLFKPGEKLSGLQVHKILEERTQGRCVPLFYVYEPLKVLTIEGKLVKHESCSVVIDGETFTKIEYSLPE